MGSNSLSGPIPKNLGSLQNLQILNSGSNLLESSDDLSFITSLTNCTDLIWLGLTQINLSGVLPDSIGNVSASLNHLWIDSNDILGTIPKEIGNLVGLEFLALYENMLTGSIPDSIGKLSKLKYFGVNINRITGKIPHSLGNMTQLLALGISENFLEGSIPTSLGNCSYLEALDLSLNRLNGTIPKEVIGLCSYSRELNFASNSLTGTLPPEVGNCKNLNTATLLKELFLLRSEN
ncbi:probable LRR receptor-like serine/threonine-protein kinase At3g47570 [Hibiscus syriacus]|uniref:probable LRR receptor-like serine/threonine-protein kinase At3g47570 n=1 Tax=Hibiscus syriacus TaxID=106335 RepID=UPI0019206D42|nr:probable LRR receptor-like serine/threonine-protein kinase At3g47570 [Hibiscus syriacus]